LAESAHQGQTRVSGEAYIIHPLHVAQILTELHLDDETVSAALLHDVVEDTIYTNEQMQEMFGDGDAQIGTSRQTMGIEAKPEANEK
jgi:GTP pyrophosphokinase